MPTLQNCTAILEVGFAVNAVSAAAQLYFRDTRRQIARRLFSEFKPDGSAVSGAYAEHAFEEFVLDASPGLRMARAGYRLLFVCGLIATLVSFVGLVYSALVPGYPISVTVVWAYAILCLIVLPLLYWSYRRFLHWFEPAFSAKKTTQDERDKLWRTFELMLVARETSMQMAALTLDVDEFILKTEWQRFRLRMALAWEKLTRPFR